MKTIILLLSLILLAACGESKTQMEVIGTRNDDLITVKPSEVKDTIDINLSDYVEDIQIIRLESTKDAMVGARSFWVYVSDNYILIKSTQLMKLFDRNTGRYIGNVGFKGRGPGEYIIAIYSAHIDEKAGNIYMLPILGTEKQEILVYDLNGKWKRRNIPLANKTPKGQFKVDWDRNRLKIAVLPFENECEYVAWEQDLDGNMINGVKANHLTSIYDYSNEVLSFGNTNELDFRIFTFQTTIDTLYHYDNVSNKLIPVFNIDCKGKKMHYGYWELPSAFIACINVDVNLNKKRELLVDKETLRGSWCRFRNDFLGGYELKNHTFRNGYYIENIEPPMLMERLEPLRESATGKARERIDYILNNMKEDDNNVVLIGKLKQ